MLTIVKQKMAPNFFFFPKRQTPLLFKPLLFGIFYYVQQNQPYLTLQLYKNKPWELGFKHNSHKIITKGPSLLKNPRDIIQPNLPPLTQLQL